MILPQKFGKKCFGGLVLLYCDLKSLERSVPVNWCCYIVIRPNLFILFECLNGEAADKKFWKRFWLIWHTTLLVIYKS